MSYCDSSGDSAEDSPCPPPSQELHYLLAALPELTSVTRHRDKTGGVHEAACESTCVKSIPQIRAKLCHTHDKG